MFREMRRKGQALPDDVCKEILEKAPHGVLAVSGDGGWPYAVPLSFVYSAGTVYFHCACEGHKLDAVRRDARASFCVVDSDEVVAEEYTTYYRSVIALFGNSYPQPLTWPEPYYLLTDAQKEEVYRPLMRRMEMAATLDTEDPDRWLQLLEGMYYILGDMDQVLAIRTERYQRKLAEGDNFAEWTNPAGYTRTNGEAVRIYDGWGRYLEYRSGGLASNQLYEYDEKDRPIRNTSTSTLWNMW